MPMMRQLVVAFCSCDSGEIIFHLLVTIWVILQMRRRLASLLRKNIWHTLKVFLLALALKLCQRAALTLVLLLALNFLCTITQHSVLSGRLGV